MSSSSTSRLWNGDIVMVYDGSPPSLIQVKQVLELATITYPSPKNIRSIKNSNSDTINISLTEYKNNDNDADDTCSMNDIDGVTCDTFLNDNDSQRGDFPDRYRQILIDFRIAVDIEFPGRYAWFAEKSYLVLRHHRVLL
ncbi:hypothetical protein FRACYDRAFT_249570 [Fragilariopsis cylindrus CCMP1102]|uniref:Uncharacterized protein n=1 Tax=Fragilariopsis cylindrus CCMP1102 TaxID=635003 RepID=A0A1E7ES36_9STRA|nr:hypothetical protein FRACYDRAFT_249570 [Fragilariopsis cylindrus CCMP1102]|eukprot:OEU08669.1 hypothetical protein FRACYDRAFT_249570 [Fragilariopsis cylindrus CCMP1102]